MASEKKPADARRAGSFAFGVVYYAAFADRVSNADRSTAAIIAGSICKSGAAAAIAAAMRAAACVAASAVVGWEERRVGEEGRARRSQDD